MNNNFLLNTFNVSLFFQIIIGIFSIDALFIKLKDNNKILYDTFLIEFIVQIIEASFYIYIISKFKKNKNITNIRYIDWAITTPIMLITTILFMEYQNQIDNNELNTKEIIDKNKKEIFEILIYNYLMLLFGFLAENNSNYKNYYIFIGFIFFILSFFKLWQNFANKNNLNKKLFTFLLVIWGLYGVSAYFPSIAKNISYNILDVISKNFYGLFIFYKIKTLKN